MLFFGYRDEAGSTIEFTPEQLIKVGGQFVTSLNDLALSINNKETKKSIEIEISRREESEEGREDPNDACTDDELTGTLELMLRKRILSRVLEG